MRSNMKKLFLSILLILSLVGVGESATYYVNSASDGGDGTTTATTGAQAAFKTVAAAQAGVTGDQSDNPLLFNRGNTWREMFTVGANGTSGHPFIIGAYGTGVNPQIYGSTVVGTWTNNSIAAVAADLLVETFDATVGGANHFTTAGDGHLDNAGWTGAKGTGCTTDADSTAISDSSGGASEILAIVKAASQSAMARYAFAGDQAITYTQFYVYVLSEGVGNTQSTIIAIARDSAATTTWTLNLYQSAGGVLGFTFSYRSGGTDVTSAVIPAAATGQWYKFEVLYDVTNHLWEWRLGGASQDSGSISATHAAGMKDVRFGGFAADTLAVSYYFDNLRIGSTGYYTAAVTGNTWKATYAPTPNSIWAVDTGGTPHWGSEKAGDSECTSLYDWFHDGVNIYINSGGTTAGYDPDTLWSAVEVGTRLQGILVSSKAYVTIQDIDTKFTNGSGIYLYRQADNAIVQRCTSTYNYGMGIEGAFGGGTEAPDNVLVTNNTVSYNGNKGISVGDYSTDWTVSYNTANNNGIDQSQLWPSGIHCYAPNGGHHVFEYNTVYSNGNALQDLTYLGAIWADRIREVPTEPPDIPIVIRKNIIYNNLMHGIFIEKTSNTDVNYNVIYGNAKGTELHAGIGVDAFVSKLASDNRIYNNTIYGNYIGLKVQSDSSAAGQIINNLIKNNIITGNTSYQVYAIAGGDNEGTYGSGNVYANNELGVPSAGTFARWGAADKDTASAFNAVADDVAGGGSNLGSNPLFVSTVTPNFHLLPNSPALNAGVNVGLTTDYSGRPIQLDIDMGAYETESRRKKSN
jgi:parallel beta-helix repeat protein